MAKFPHWPLPHHGRFILGLDKMVAAVDRLRSPHLKIPPVVHVTGTNGKGSTCANLSSIFKESGYSWHRYTSPHLMQFNERIVINGQEIDDIHLFQFLEECRMKCDDIPLSFFEGTTAAAFLAFSKYQADVLVMEVGMGGRYDATNIIESPLMTIITPISFDHTEYLGDTIGLIAAEKAEIIKPSCYCVISWQLEEAMDILVQKCEKLSVPYLAWGINWIFKKVENKGFIIYIKCPLEYISEDFIYDYNITKNKDDIDEINNSDKNNSDKNITQKIIDETFLPSENIVLRNDDNETYLEIELILPRPGLIGIHQYINAATSAVSAWWLSKMKKLNSSYKLNNYSKININNIANGLTKAKWIGRMERITNGFLGKIVPQHSELWLDGAHNPAGAEMLSASLLDMQPQLPLYVINGRTMQRDIKGFLQFFLGKARMVCGVLVVSEPSGEKAENIRDVAQEMGFIATAADSLLDAVKICLADAKGMPCRIIICGSLYLAGDVLLANKGIG
ncbi:bifunctional folylpolyglutamate synthase/dihydrofolate synthase [Lyticum sinuosum]|uniref:Bifunctional protein FolC n=1 Tax=Lyticum sinuosum TaxID=1332059 RepID=A0AAE5AI10_9RICK|nr:folylpolyglutamate synthase/dihydrofolate synthase family protein [Lyticum sinuosum]MDZ5761449.1 Bifunctional protein FolC [Lyticum sinuosum]